VVLLAAGLALAALVQELRLVKLGHLEISTFYGITRTFSNCVS
jgi:hypothetical protein